MIGKTKQKNKQTKFIDTGWWVRGERKKKKKIILINTFL